MAPLKPAERRLLRRFVQDRRGVAAIEFAFIAPIMVLLYCGMAELCQAVIAERKADHVASAVGDLVSQTSQVTTADLSDIFSVGNTIMAPFPSVTLQMRVTSLTADSNGVPRVDWSHGSGSLTPLAAGSAVSLPLTLTSGESIVMSESAYQYSSVLQYLLPNVLNYNEAYYLRPRMSDSVTCSNC